MNNQNSGFKEQKEASAFHQKLYGKNTINIQNE